MPVEQELSNQPIEGPKRSKIRSLQSACRTYSHGRLKKRYGGEDATLPPNERDGDLLPADTKKKLKSRRVRTHIQGSCLKYHF